MNQATTTPLDLMPAAPPRLTSSGVELDLSPSAFGWLRASTDLAETDTTGEALRARMEEDGYLFLPGYLDASIALEARAEMAGRLADAGALADDTDPLETRARTGERRYFMPELALNNKPLRQLLYEGRIMDVFARFYGAPVRHYDFTWMRVVSPGGATAPHCDVVYMGRGTHAVCTAWTPLGDIPLSVGGLMVLENSHRKADVLADYLSRDVDSYCANGPNAEKVQSGKMNWEAWDGSGKEWNGALTNNPALLRSTLGGRWLTAPEYRPGDVLIFTMRTVHASIDNASDQIRLSSDSRYQRADEPADERWIGSNPIGHSLAAKRGRIC